MADRFKAFGRWWPMYDDTNVCIWCGVGFESKGPLAKSYEHIVPQSHFTEDTRERKVSASHRACNSVRGDDTRWVPWYAGMKQMPRRQRAQVDKVKSGNASRPPLRVLLHNLSLYIPG